MRLLTDVVRLVADINAILACSLIDQRSGMQNGMEGI